MHIYEQNARSSPVLLILFDVDNQTFLFGAELDS